MWSVSGVFAPALSEPKARSRAGARRLCDGVRRSRPTSCRQPEHRSHQTRSAAAASFARCIIENIFYRQSGGAGSGGSPDKAGAYCEELTGLFGLMRKAKGTSQSYPYCTVCGAIPFYFKNAFCYWVLFICVFSDGYSYIERPEEVAGHERHPFPVQTGNIFRSRPATRIAIFCLNGEMQAVEIGLPQSPLCDFQ